MSGDTLAALRKAATVLLDAAPLPVVQEALRTLLAGTEAAEPRNQLPPPTGRPRGRPAVRGKAPAAASWLALRRRVQAAMRDRGLDVAGLAHELGLSHHTVRNSLGRRTPSSTALTRRLTDWLAGAEVARPRCRFVATVPVNPTPPPPTELQPPSAGSPVVILTRSAAEECLIRR